MSRHIVANPFSEIQFNKMNKSSLKRKYQYTHNTEKCQNNVRIKEGKEERVQVVWCPRHEVLENASWCPWPRADPCCRVRREESERGVMEGVTSGLSWLWWWFPGNVYVKSHQIFHFKYVHFVACQFNLNYRCNTLRIASEGQWELNSVRCHRYLFPTRRKGWCDAFLPMLHLLQQDLKKEDDRRITVLTYVLLPLLCLSILLVPWIGSANLPRVPLAYKSYFSREEITLSSTSPASLKCGLIWFASTHSKCTVEWVWAIL